MRLPSLIIMLGTIIFAAPAQAAFFGLFDNTVENVAAKDGVIIVDVSGLPKAEARHYSYKEDGKVVRFFVVRDEEGVVRAALDACESCWRAGRGYKLTEGIVLCVSCGQRFALSRIGLAAGGCNPHPFQYKVENESLVIEARELMLEARYFPENNK
jgi:uncharacterized membrane protein